MKIDTSDCIQGSAKIIVLVVLVFSLAGCVSMSDFDGSSETSQCKLMHEIVDPSGGYSDVIERYAYENLSSNGQRVFEEAVARGSYSTTNQSLEAPEFRYWDETASYTIIYQNETYKLLTYTGSGCE